MEGLVRAAAGRRWCRATGRRAGTRARAAPLPGGDRRARCAAADAGRRWSSRGRAPTARPVDAARRRRSRRGGRVAARARQHVFGSGELSVLTPGIAAQAPAPYVAVNAADAATSGARPARLLDVLLDGQTARLPLRVDVRCRPGSPACRSGCPACRSSRCRPGRGVAPPEAEGVRPMSRVDIALAVHAWSIIVLIVMLRPDHDRRGADLARAAAAGALGRTATGPNRVGPFGLLPGRSADMIKIFTKEDWIPPFADRPVFVLAPAIVIGRRCCCRSPSSPSRRASSVADLNIGLLFFLAMSSLGVYSVVLGGWSSNNKYCAARRPARRGADAQLRGLHGPLAHGRGDAGRLVQPRRHRRAPSARLWFCVPQFVGLRRLLRRRAGRDAPPARSTCRRPRTSWSPAITPSTRA